MWNVSQKSRSTFPVLRLRMKKSPLPMRRLALRLSTWSGVHSLSCSTNADPCDSETMARTLPAQSEPLSSTGINKRTAWRRCGRFASFVLAGLTGLSGFATTPSFAVTTNISCFKDFTTGDCASAGDSVNSAVRVNVIATVGGGGGGTSSTFGAAFPATGTAGGFFDGVNMQGSKVFDLDTGAGTDYNVGISLRKPAAGGSVLFGTVTDPMFTSETVAFLLDATFTARINTLGQKTMAASTPVVLPSDQAAIPVTGPLTDAQLRATPVPVSGTVAVSNALLLDATFTGRINTLGQKTMANSTPVVLPSDQSAIPVSATALPLPVNAAQETGGNLAIIAAYETSRIAPPVIYGVQNKLTYSAQMGVYCRRVLCPKLTGGLQ